MNAPCPLCGSTRTWRYYANPEVTVTGDSRVTERGVDARCCEDCASVFKVRTGPVAEALREIYESYVLYGTDERPEHRVAFDKYPEGIEKTRYQVEYLFSRLTPSAAGRILDLGCHYGAFLQAFRQRRPDWELVGFDVSEKFRPAIEGLSGPSAYVSGEVGNVPGRFDLIAVSHVIEHVDDPAATLAFVKSRLRPGGVFYMQLIDATANPFSPLMFEQHFNFTPPGIRALMEAAGFSLIEMTGEWIDKEISLLARADGEAPAAAPGAASSMDRATATAVLKRNSALLNRMGENLGRLRACGRQVGVFGTAVAGTWAGALLGGSLGYFVDENPQARQRPHCGKPVLAPESAPAGSSVLVCLPEPVAARIVDRLGATCPARLVPPPFDGL